MGDSTLESCRRLIIRGRYALHRELVYEVVQPRRSDQILPFPRRQSVLARFTMHNEVSFAKRLIQHTASRGPPVSFCMRTENIGSFCRGRRPQLRHRIVGSICRRITIE
jgi:hypothetical protein